MNKIMLFYQKHSTVIDNIIALIIIPIVLLKTIDFIVAKTTENKDVQQETRAEIEANRQISAVTGEKKANNEYDSQTSIIEEFLNDCNERKN